MDKRHRIGIGLLLVCLALFQIPFSYAQDEEKAYEIVRIKALMALPTAINFRVNLTAPEAEIRRITLDIGQKDWFQRSIELDLEHAVLFRGEEDIEYQYTLNLKDATEVRVFLALDYRFTVEVEGLEEPLTANSQAVVQHQVVHRWFAAGTDELRLHWASERFPGDGYLRDLRPVLNLLKIQTGYNQSIGFVVYEPNTPICQQLTLDDGQVIDVILTEGLVYSCDPTDLKTFYDNNHMYLIETNTTQQQQVTNLLTELMVNSVYEPRWEGVEVPAWFQVGLGMFYAYRGQTNMLTVVQRASQQDQLLRLPQMATSTNRNQLWEAQAYLLTLYLAETYGATVPFDIALAMNAEVSFTDALKTVTDDSIERIYAAWSIWMNSPRAGEVVFWNPYQPTTPTPTLTFTPSDIPPSPTTRPSPTITSTPTRPPLYEPTIELATRAIPTFRPTASVTPLPPGFFDTPTIAPTATPAKEKSSGGVCGTGIGATIIPLVGLLMARRKRHD